MRPSEYLSRIAASSGAMASGIGELAGAEVKSSAKGLGIGAGMFAGAGLFGYTSLKILGFGVGFLFAWIFWKAAGLSVLFSLFLGFVLLFVLFLIVIAAMAIIGKGQFKHVKMPQGTIEEVKASFGAIGTSIPAGVKDAEDALDEAKVVKAQAKAATSRVNIVRDPIYLARQRRAARAA
ncbi:MAG: phage holin family protein [Propionibacteriaceae bacterium]|nr:phage holin family protein [Propionibacteriaceae bacterium]